MTIACDSLLQLRYINPFPIVERLRMTASSVTNIDTQAAIQRMIASRLWD